MSVEFSDAGALLTYTGVVRPWSTCRQEFVCVGVWGGSWLSKFWCQEREHVFQSTCRRVGSFFWVGDAPSFPSLKLSVPDSFHQPLGTPYNILAGSLEGWGPDLISAGWSWLRDPTQLCSLFLGWDFTPHLMVKGLPLWGRFLGLTHYPSAFYHCWLSCLNRIFYVSDWIHLIPNHFPNMPLFSKLLRQYVLDLWFSKYGLCRLFNKWCWENWTATV